MCPHTTIYQRPHTTTRCVLILLLDVSSYQSYHYVSSVLMLLCMCPHTPMYVSSYCYMCPHTTTRCVLILLYVCHHTALYLALSYCCIADISTYIFIYIDIYTDILGFSRYVSSFCSISSAIILLYFRYIYLYIYIYRYTYIYIYRYIYRYIGLLALCVLILFYF